MFGPQDECMTEELLRKLYMEEGGTIGSVAKHFGCGGGTVYRALTFYGIPLKSRKEASRAVLRGEAKKLQDRDWLGKQLETHKVGEIAKELGVSGYLVKKWGILHGLVEIDQVRSAQSKRGIADRYPEGRKGPSSGNWRGGLTEGKYRYVWVECHPNTGKPGKIQEHRMVMSQVLDRPLRRDEVVHHIDGNGLNNDPSNLEVKTRNRHVSEHFQASHEVIQARKLITELTSRVAELEAEILELRSKS